MDILPIGFLAALVGLLGGLVLGLGWRLGGLCTLAALETAVYGTDQKRLRLWGIVLGVAILGTQFGARIGWINLEGTLYHAIAWNPLASVVGGLMFGYGMAMAGNCGFGALARFGGGDLRSLVLLVVMGITGFMALSGPLAPLRIFLFPQPDASGPAGIVYDLQMSLGIPALLTIIGIAVSCFAWALSNERLRADRKMIIWGIAAGLAVTWCFAGTSYLSDVSLGAISPEGPSFTAPIGRSLIYLMTATAGGITFSVGSVVGVALGAFIGSMIKGTFVWEACEDPRELGRQVGGAALMGIGGIVAMGCSIGQGVSGVAALAWSGPVTLACIVIGALVGLRQLIGGFQAI
ncbi:MAG: YeeE/YedE family protein [Allorhizobium sp.]